MDFEELTTMFSTKFIKKAFETNNIANIILEIILLNQDSCVQIRKTKPVT